MEPKQASINEDICDMIQDEYTGECGIVYCTTRKECEVLAEQLMARGIMADYYHGKVTPSAKKAALQAWLDGKVQVMCATQAFGMGIDKASVEP